MNNVIENSLVTGILFLIIIAPIILASRRAKRKRLEKSAAALHELAGKNHLNLTKSDIFGNSALGLDALKNVLIYVNTQSNELICKTDLSRISSCEIVQSMDQNSITSIQLVLYGKEQPFTSISFYKQFHDDEMKIKQFQQLVETWKQEIDQLISRKKTA
ncbi:MAG TPA: hypothetical protein VEV16_02370 [Daejeonella sp.]|nr:hypothetical protein [Daejeonella sp.]